MKLSIVTSLYCSEKYLDEFVRRCAAAAGENYEIILVNDGSPDDSLQKALSLQQQEPAIRIVDLSRNFGHHKALMTGIRAAQGSRIFLIDCDLEEPPELLHALTDALNADPEADVAYGVQNQRKGGWFERISGGIFYRIMQLLSEVEYPADTLTARLMSRRYADALKEFDDREYDLWVNFALAGFRQIPVPADKGDKGTSCYTLRRKIRHAVESITASSAMPLYLIFLMGILVFAAAVLHLGFLVVNKLFFDVPVGWSHVVASIWGIGGLTMIGIGTVGVYLAKVFIETKKRPAVIIRQVYDGKK